MIYTLHLRRYENGNQIDIWCPLIEGICQPDIYYQVIFIRTLWLESEITMRKLGLKSHHPREKTRAREVSEIRSVNVYVDRQLKQRKRVNAILRRLLFNRSQNATVA